MKQKATLTEGSIVRHLVRLTIPTIGGILAITIFNLTDTYFVARLGTDALAAMGFTFPVIMVIGSIAMGLGTGATSVLSRALGRGDQHLVRRTATDGLFLAIATVGVIGIVGWFTIDPLFRAMGATETTLPLIRQYMQIWYLGAAAAFVPPVGDGCLRATGDMVRPLIVMTTCATLNAILDPIMIFGLFGFPRMELAGAALATVLSRCVGMTASLLILHFHAHLLEWRWPGVRDMLQSWRRILHVGIPAALTHVLMPFSRGVVTRLAAGAGGATAVAAMAAGARIESLAIIVPIAYATALMPVIGQNWGGGLFNRVETARRLSNRLALVFGLAEFVFFLAAAPFLARQFSDDPVVTRWTVHYLWIVCAGHMGLHAGIWTAMALNAVGKPKRATALNFVQTILVAIPLAVAGRALHGFTGLLIGLALSQLITGLLAVWVGRRLLRSAPTTPPPGNDNGDPLPAGSLTAQEF